MRRGLNLKLSVLGMLGAGAVVIAWILATGFWDDTQPWDDTQTWKDS